MDVYIENVLFENIMIDGLILFLVTKTLREKINWLGIVFSSLFGALFALFSVRINVEGILSAVIKLFLGVCMAYIVDFRFQNLIKKALLLFLYTFLFGGMVSFVFNFLGVSTKNGINFQYKSGVPVVGLVVLCVVLFLYLFLCLKKLYKKKKISAFLYEITLSVHGKMAVLHGFLDTGNTLVGKGGKPILMVSQKK